MAVVDPAFLLGAVLLLYLGTFVLFALIRILTGVSIQRAGYFSLRRIGYTYRKGIRIELRGLSLALRRPTFAQPTWLSIVLEDLKIVVGTEAFQHEETKQARRRWWRLGRLDITDIHESERKGPWATLTRLKDQIKRLHRRIHWLRMLDLACSNSRIEISQVCSIEIGSLTAAIDTRRRTIDRGRIFHHLFNQKSNCWPAEWIFTCRNVLLTTQGEESTEILDHISLNIYGSLSKEHEGLRDAHITLKMGRLSLPSDEMVTAAIAVQTILRPLHPGPSEKSPKTPETDDPFTSAIDNDDLQQLFRSVEESKEFLASIMRGVQEVQLAVGSFILSKHLAAVTESHRLIRMEFTMKEIGLDLHRMDSHGPAQRMYFSKRDVAHEGLLAAIALAVSFAEGSAASKNLLYVPMATTTIRTNLPSKAIEIEGEKNLADRNATVLLANVVITSPAVDISPQHLPLILSLISSRRRGRTKAQHRLGSRHAVISHLLPRAKLRLTVHEPVFRAILPADTTAQELDDYDLLVATTSVIALDIESAHSAAGDLRYSLTSQLRVTTQDVYYQAASGDRHDILHTGVLELGAEVHATPDLQVVLSGNLQTIVLRVVRPEISRGLRQITHQLFRPPDHVLIRETNSSQKSNIVRRLPPWLTDFSIEGRDIEIEISDQDLEVSATQRGVAVQLGHWSMVYEADHTNKPEKVDSRRKSTSRSSIFDGTTTSPSKTGKAPANPRATGDGRSLSLYFHNLDGFIVRSVDAWEEKPFFSMPHTQIALSTHSDSEGPISHLNTSCKAITFEFSLHRFYAIGLGMATLRAALNLSPADLARRVPATSTSASLLGIPEDSVPTRSPAASPMSSPSRRRSIGAEIFVVDAKILDVRFHAIMPAHPSLLVELHIVTIGSHRWSSPFIGADVVRVVVQTPSCEADWSRLVGITRLRVDFRSSKRRVAKQIKEERFVGVNVDFVRIAVPSGLVVYKIFDNIVNLWKASTQLHHRFSTGTNEYILVQRPKPPKLAPKLILKCRRFAIELEDSAFEWRLGIIYRTGLIEQRRRMVRQDAFDLKSKKMFETADSGSRNRPRSAQRRGRSNTRNPGVSAGRDDSSKSKPAAAQSSRSDESPHANVFRYQSDAPPRMTKKSKISKHEASIKLAEYDARSWKQRIDQAYESQTCATRELQRGLWDEEADSQPASAEKIPRFPLRPALLHVMFNHLSVTVDEPSFPTSDYAKFVHRVGGGMPLDMRYSLLYLMSLKFTMGEARMTLRDYPLPLLHIPPLKPSQSAHLPSWTLKTDLVLAEELRDAHSIRNVRVDVLAPKNEGSEIVDRGFAINVQRTVSPLKTYSDIDISITSANATQITWGTSYQPAIQDAMMVIETFTKPQVDPSERMGFWDKIRLTFHSRVKIAWIGDGDVNVMLKGSRDPYIITGYGAGFVQCWRNNVVWSINCEPDPRKLMTVDSGDYVLAIPDYSAQARSLSEAAGLTSTSSFSSPSFKNAAQFKKVIMKLSGKVRWIGGLVLERTGTDGQRTFLSKDHWDVVLKTPTQAKQLGRERYDAFQGFRSDFIHMSIAVIAPRDRDWSIASSEPSSNYNTVHLTPRFFTHFFAWWSLFSGVMSLPVRHGSLWPGSEKTSKKLSRHLVTFKYNLLLAPLYISHVYKHKDAEDYSTDRVAVTGLKMRLDSFILDLHQRREEFASTFDERRVQNRTTHMRIYKTQLDMIHADIRALSASLAGTSVQALQSVSDEKLASFAQNAAPIDLSRFEISDRDFSWIDMDDFVELDWILPSETHPATRIAPLAFAPHFTYFRQIDHQGRGDETCGTSSFGFEDTHYCIMSQENGTLYCMLAIGNY